MKALGIVAAAALILGLGGTSLPAPAHAQLFQRDPPPTYRAPPQQQRRLPGTSRQYVPEQEAQPRRRGFFERLFGGRDDDSSPRSFDRGRAGPQQRQPSPQQQQPETAAPVAPRVPKTVFVALIGDSVADNIAPGLTDSLAERPEVGIVREVRPGQGLLDETPKTWRQSADEILARTPPVAAAVIFLTPDGDVPKPPARGEGTPPPLLRTLPWMDEYATRVDDIALAFRQRGIPLLWVGLPPVASPKTMAEYAVLNDLVRQRVAALGGVFIDVWEGFVNEDEEYTVQGPNIEGRVVRLRMADGLHFSRAGARKVGHYIELELRNYLSTGDQGDAIADLGVDPALPTIPGHSRVLMLGEAPRTPGGVLLPPTPAAINLPKPIEENPEATASSEAALDTPVPDAIKPDETRPEENALATGAAIPSRPGRADDFAWPATAAN